MMDNKFPNKLFPNFCHTGPPKGKSDCPVEGWGLYNQILGDDLSFSEGSCDVLVDWDYQPQRKIKASTWVPVEATVAPLLRPSRGGRCAADVTAFPEQIMNFYQEYSDIAVGTMGRLLGDHFCFRDKRLTAGGRISAVDVEWTKRFLTSTKYKKCPLKYFGKRPMHYSRLLGDVIHDIPPALLAELLREELAAQRDQQKFNEMGTGGAIGYFQLTSSTEFQEGCLIYPRRAGLNSLHFRKVVTEACKDTPSLKFMNKPVTYKVCGPVRQICVGSMEESVQVGVRSDYSCGVWMASRTTKPLPLEVIKTSTRATCLSVSPHMPGELLVACESGKAYLWTVGRGFREEEGNLYFNAQSPWRWCDFSAHPRVMQYADRTGLELTDMRSSKVCTHTLFRIGENFSCKSGERLILSKYIGDVDAHHHLVTTQYAAYIVDERFPSFPMLKWDHMMADPPVFAQLLAGSSEQGNKLLLGSQRSQEIILLQYCGGSDTACQALGAPQKLSCPMSSLIHLPLQVPHRQKMIQKRLEAPAAGITSVYHGQKEHLCVLQLSQTGDIFYQILRPISQDALQPKHKEMVNESSAVTELADNSTCESQECVLGQRTYNSANKQQREHGTDDEEVVSDCNNPFDTSDSQMRDVRESCNLASENVASLSAQTRSNLANKRSVEVQTSEKALGKWESWLNAVDTTPKHVSKSTKAHWTSTTKGLYAIVDCGDPQEKNRIDALRSSMREAMKRKGVLTHSATALPRLDACPPPERVDMQNWSDDLSRRLSMSWQGRWKDWWEEKLGLNRQRKIEELRKRRRQQKQARALSHVALSGSFTSSVSYQSEVDDWQSWSMGTSAFGDDSVSNLDAESLSCRLSTQGLISVDSERIASLDLQQSSEGSNLAFGKQSEGTLMASRTNVPKNLAQDMEQKHLKQDYLSSLFVSQEASNDAGVEENDLPIPMSSSCPVSSISFSQRIPSIVPSSQGSLYSKPAKKRQRMGF